MSKDEKHTPRHDDCIYNDGIQCEKHEACRKCGWNPQTAEQRLYWRRVTGADHVWIKKGGGVNSQ